MFRSVIRPERHLKMIILLPTQSAHNPSEGMLVVQKKDRTRCSRNQMRSPVSLPISLSFLASAAGRYQPVAS